MGTNYDDECSPSILVRYSSDNDSEDQVFPADPRLVQAQLEAQGQPPPPPPPPASPVTGVSTTSTSPFPDLWGLERSLTPSPTMDSPGEPVVGPPERPQGFEDKESGQEITQTTMCTSANDQSTLEAKSESCKVATAEFSKSDEKMKLLEMKKGVNDQDEELDPGCSGCFMPAIRTVVGASRKTFSNIRRNVMEWVQAHSARPSSSRQQDTLSIADQERQQAEEFVRDNSHRNLEELLTENKAAQVEKVKEYDEMRKRKAPCLSDQRRGPDGRIIFSKEYVDFIMYRDLQPLVDLRVLQRIEEMLLSKIRDQQLVEQLEETKLTGEEPTTSSITAL